jgi:hypothetical protein
MEQNSNSLGLWCQVKYFGISWVKEISTICTAIHHCAVKGTKLQKKQFLHIRGLKIVTKQIGRDNLLLPVLSNGQWTHLIFSLH